MTRTSAIFGVVSVLTAAIVGGVFIRQKIISDSLYWKAWAEFEAERKRNIRSVEEEINTLNSSLKTQEKDKNNIGKKIEKYQKDMEKLVKDIEQHEEQMKYFENYNITMTVFETITKNLAKQKSLEDKIEKFRSEMNNLFLNSEEIDSENDFEAKIKNFRESLETQQERIKIYANRRILWHKQFENHKNKKENKMKDKEKIEKELEDSKSSLASLESLIKAIMLKLEEKISKLSALKEQKFKSN